MIELEDIKARVQGHALVRSVDVARSGAVRVETAFLYPDGSSVDVFVREGQPPSSSLELTDLGQTTEWLLDLQVEPSLSEERQRLIEDALRIYGVQQAGGALELPIASVDALIDGILRLGQACVRVADLTYTRRCPSSTSGG